MVFQNLGVLVLRMKVASALEGLLESNEIIGSYGIANQFLGYIQKDSEFL